MQLLKASLVVVLLCATVALYKHLASVQSGVNFLPNRSDQGAYRNFAIDAYTSNFQYTGGRNRMPLYPWIQALFYSPELTNEQYFGRAKLINTWLSVALLMLVGAAFFRKFSRMYAAYAMLSIAFLAFVFKAPFFQAELLYYSLFGLAFMLSIETLQRPSWRKSIGVGVLFMLAHFTKASALPALLLFASSYGLLFLLRWAGNRLDMRAAGRLAAQALLPIGVFLLLLSPYLHESRVVYGSYFYNVNTTFYVWYDSWGEAKAGTRAAGDRVGYPDMPAEDIPRLEKYLSDHSTEHVVNRFRRGAERLLAYSCYLENSVHLYGYCSQVGLGLLVLAASMLLLAVTVPRAVIWRQLPLCWYIAALFFAYFMGAAWYMPISGNEGARVALVLLIPFFWTTGLLVHSPQVQSLRISVSHYSLSVVTLVYSLLGVTLAHEIVQVITFRAASMYGGK